MNGPLPILMPGNVVSVYGDLGEKVFGAIMTPVILKQTQKLTPPHMDLTKMKTPPHKHNKLAGATTNLVSTGPQTCRQS